MPLFVEADEIAPNLWQGSYPATGRAVAASGFSMLVLCAVELQEPADLWPGVEVVYAPNYDDKDHPLTHELLNVAKTAAHKVTGAVRQGRQVLVTCRAGLNRSGLVVGLALHQLYGWDGHTCIDRVKARRRHPKCFEPLANRDFRNAILRLRPPGSAPKGWVEGPGGVLIPA
jgi:hypothetical protein